MKAGHWVSFQLEHTRHSKDIRSHCLARRMKVQEIYSNKTLQTLLSEGMIQDIEYIKSGRTQVRS